MVSACARAPALAIRAARSSTLAFVRPARNTSAPCAANSVATAEPIEPPAPKITARFPFKIPDALIDLLPWAEVSILRSELGTCCDHAVGDDLILLLVRSLRPVRPDWNDEQRERTVAGNK